MCCFTRPVRSVSATRIFARMGENGRQFLVYSMNVTASEPLAMVLPIPAAPGSAEDAVRFISLQNYPDFFEDMNSGFPAPPAPASEGVSRATISASAPLKVVSVGSFEASFVPKLDDFSRLDERFRLPPDALKKLSGYLKYGFAVFKLKPGEQRVHPMAFEFPTALETQVFFPTVHIHDGKVHDRAKFDHALYCQSTETLRLKVLDWTESIAPARRFMKEKKSEGLVLLKEHCYRLELHGTLPNKDTFLDGDLG